VTLIVVDLVPALLTWEGRDASDPRVAPEALEVLEDLYAGFRLAAVADGDQPASRLRYALDELRLSEFFESIGTSAGFGPAVTPRVIRRLAAGLGALPGDLLVVTARPALAEALRRARLGVVLTDGPDDFVNVPDAVADLMDGPLSP
jgi:FMN phosphatase YigB (HAD superfamily)